MKLWNKILILFLIFLAIFVVLGILYYNGYLDNTNWKILTMIGATAAGPYMFVRKWFKEKVFAASDGDKITALQKKYLESVQNEKIIRDKLRKQISDKDKEIANLKSKLSVLNADLKKLQQQRENVEDDVNELSFDDVLSEFDEEF